MNRHARIVKLGLDKNPKHATQLLNDYISSETPNSLTHAYKLFNQVPSKDTVLWSSLISAYTRSNKSEAALHLFTQMTHQTQQPNHFIYATIAKACAASTKTHTQFGKTIHTHVIQLGFLPNYVVVGTSLLDMYSKWGFVDCSLKLFDEMGQRNLVTWNAMIDGCVQNGMEVQGLELFYRMKCREFLVPDEFSIATALVGCGWSRDLVLGKQLHSYLIVTGIELNCGNAVCNMYFQCGEVSCAEKVLSELKENIVSKLMRIRGYVVNQKYHDAMKYVSFQSNVATIFEVDHTVIVPILTCCAKLSLLNVGRQIHGLFVTMIGLHDLLEEDGIIIGSALINMYCKCGSAADARKVFDSWFLEEHVAIANSMISGYLFNGMVEEASSLFDSMVERDVVTWTSMISGYVQNDMPQHGLELLARMYAREDRFSIEGNCYTFVAGIEACSHLTDQERGKQIHAKIIRSVMCCCTYDVVIGTSLVDMYSKFGSLRYAQIVFSLILEKNVYSYTSIILGYAINGEGSRALKIFQEMTAMGIEPNEVTFVSVLAACSHCGLVGQGLHYFTLMWEKYGMVPREDHYTCLVDMLGRFGMTEEAWDLLEEIGHREMSNGFSSGTVWSALLGACWLHGNMEMGRRVARHLLEKNQNVSATYVTISNVYAAAGM
ncbi:Pentatricopeptide repeat [Dillenia turbinata]|uniref:Pentatricopeptide repeat n=1 Tax=Dillenia turbinata TaxID=194707 RepID=A0AAN8VXL3_9MAGN